MTPIREERVRVPHDGIHYQDFLGQLASSIKPSTYFEIGTNAGSSLAQIGCDALCVDPNFVIVESPLASRRRSLFFQMTSDDFFATYNVKTYFEKGVDLALLDGMHWFEFLLRDFIGTEKISHNRSLVLMHDCLPINTRMAERIIRADPGEDPITRDWWTGDVWRLLPIFKKYRPDLRILLLDCPPTGLVAISNLDPSNDVLDRNYHAIVDEFASVDLAEYSIDRIWSLYPSVDTKSAVAADNVTSVFTIC